MLFLTAQLPFSAKLSSRSPPPPKKSSEREREYLHPSEVESLMAAAHQIGRHGIRDAAMILLMFRHGLRTAELVALKWSSVDLTFTIQCATPKCRPKDSRIFGQIDRSQEIIRYPQTLSRHKQAIRSYLQVSQFTQETNSFIREIIKESALVKDNPADLINVVIEELVKNRYELPPFATLDRLVRHGRNLVNQQLFAQVTSQLSQSAQQRLNDLLDSQTHRQRSCYNDLKKLPKKSSRNHLNDLLVHLTWLETLGDVQDLIKPLTASKIKHFAGEAKALNAGELKDITIPKRLTLLLCLIYTAQVQTRDSKSKVFFNPKEEWSLSEMNVKQLMPTKGIITSPYSGGFTRATAVLFYGSLMPSS